jgi:RNA polymerase sigma-70 factor (ECF subfamily)
MDGDLLARVKEGETEARGDIYQRCFARVAGCIAGLVADARAVPDLTHDVFVKAFESAAGFQGAPAAFVPWLLVIARNTATDHGRRSCRTRLEEPEIVERRLEEAPPATDEWGADAAIHALIAGLPAEQRRVLTLHYRGGLDPTDIGHVLGKSADAVRHLEHRALEAIRAGLPS